MQNEFNQGQGQGQRPVGPPPKTYLAESIIVTIICCWPLGIPAIINAAKVDRLHQQGLYADAQRASEKAKQWCIYSAIGAAVFIVLYFLFVFLIVGLENF
ncbi:CD225/dispanin family protein [Nonlabens sp. Asnod3-A02]|uniref:CD225/dispanin family protein n=1 Tax=Nonlabens sp. Asnod3-A02 TaxID=3160579 RepID=UPI00386F3CE0